MNNIFKDDGRVSSLNRSRLVIKLCFLPDVAIGNKCGFSFMKNGTKVQYVSSGRLALSNMSLHCTAAPNSYKTAIYLHGCSA